MRDLPHRLFKESGRLVLFDENATPAEKLRLLLDVELDDVISFPGWTWGDITEVLYALKQHGIAIYNTLGFACPMHFPEGITATMVGSAVGASQLASTTREPLAVFVDGDAGTAGAQACYQPSQSDPHILHLPEPAPVGKLGFVRRKGRRSPVDQHSYRGPATLPGTINTSQATRLGRRPEPIVAPGGTARAGTHCDCRRQPWQPTARCDQVPSRQPLTAPATRRFPELPRAGGNPTDIRTRMAAEAGHPAPLLDLTKQGYGRRPTAETAPGSRPAAHSSQSTAPRSHREPPGPPTAAAQRPPAN